jgi:hypothetical protein
MGSVPTDALTESVNLRLSTSIYRLSPLSQLTPALTGMFTGGGKVIHLVCAHGFPLAFMALIFFSA